MTDEYFPKSKRFVKGLVKKYLGESVEEQLPVAGTEKIGSVDFDIDRKNGYQFPNVRKTEK